MKKYIVHIILAVVIIVLAVVIGGKYFNKQDSAVNSNSVVSSEPVATATPEPTPTVEPTEAPHEHVYTETVTTEATCEADGLKTFACECGDSYTEVITATGHVFENYVYNNDATYKADGTETATCVCGLTDTQTAFGSMLKYTFTPMNVIMYAQQTVNVRNLPCTDGEKIDSLSTNTEVLVTGQCIETGWYEIEVRGYSAYVSDSYLGTSKVAVNTPSNPSTPSTGGGTITITDSSGTHVYTEEEAIAMGYIPSGGGEYARPPMDLGDGGELVGDVEIKPAGD